MHFRFLCNLKKKCCRGEPNFYMSSLCKWFQSYKGCVPMHIYGLFPQNGFLPSIGIPFLQCPRSQYEKKVYLFFIIFKERLLIYVLKTEELVYIFNTLNVDIVKEVICVGGGGAQWIVMPVKRMVLFSCFGSKGEIYDFLFSGNRIKSITISLYKTEKI